MIVGHAMKRSWAILIYSIGGPGLDWWNQLSKFI